MRNTRNAAAIAALLALAAALCCPALALAADESLTGGLAAVGVAKTTKAPAVKVAATTQGAKIKVKSVDGISIASGDYVVAAGGNTQLTMAVAGDSKASGSNVTLQDEGLKSQVWTFKYNYYSNTYIVTNKISGKALTVTGSAKDGDNVRLETLKSSKDLHQRWLVTSTPTGYQITSAFNQKVSLAVAGKKASSGKNVRVNRSKDDVQQRFWFYSTKTYSKSNVFRGGYYTLTNANPQASKLAIGSKKSSVKKKAQFAVNKLTKDLSQVYEITPVRKGYYKIISVNSGLALTARGSLIVQDAFKGYANKNQVWKPTLTADGIRFVNRNGKALDIAKAKAGSKAKAAKLDKESSTQLWVASPVTTGISAAGMCGLAKANARSSGSNYFVAADLTAFEVNVFIRKNASSPWTVIKRFSVACGMNKCTHAADGRVWSKWKYYGDTHGYRAWYWTNLGHGRSFHSVICHAGTQSISDSRTWGYISNGCMRLKMSNAKWLWDTVPKGTNVSWFY